MYRKRTSTLSRNTLCEELPKPEPIDWEGDERSAEFRQQFEGKDGEKPFEYFGRDMERHKFYPARDERPAYTLVPNLSHKKQAVIGGLLSLSRVQTSESGTDTDIKTVMLPSKEAGKEDGGTTQPGPLPADA